MKTFLALVIMFLVPLLFGWFPLAGLAAGVLGGYLIGRPGRGVLLALLPSVVLPGIALVAGVGLGVPLIGAVVAGFALLWMMVHSVLLLAGAFLGGLFYKLNHPEDSYRRQIAGYYPDLLG